MHFVYILQSKKDNFRYIGSTKNINNRLLAHNNGSNRSTKPHRPYKIIYLEQLSTKTKALKKEKLLKSYKGGKALTNLINSWDGGVVNHISL